MAEQMTPIQEALSKKIDELYKFYQNLPIQKPFVVVTQTQMEKIKKSGRSIEDIYLDEIKAEIDKP